MYALGNGFASGCRRDGHMDEWRDGVDRGLHRMGQAVGRSLRGAHHEKRLDQALAVIFLKARALTGQDWIG